jgi:carboxyl-terminal processing protease
MLKFRGQGLVLLLVVAVCLFRASGVDDNDPKLVRWRMQRILKDVSYTVETSFYDPKLNGVDWKASVEIARQQIDTADHIGQMITAITVLLARLNDSHTVFFPPRRTEHAVFGFDAEPFGEDVLVYDVMPKGPADAAGLQIGDRILAINDFGATRSNIEIMLTYFRFLDPVRELPLTIGRGNRTQVIKVKAELQSELSKDLSHVYDMYTRERKKESEPIAKDYDGGIVYLRFPSFEMLPHDAGAFVGKAKNAHAIILDLRENGGGRGETLEEVAGHFFNERGKLADVIGRNQTVSAEIKLRNPNLACPLFVLVDSRSASASEVLARYIQIKHRGKIVGDRTSGRVNVSRIVPGTVGSVYPVRYALEITVGRAVMVDGQGLEGRGVSPDEVCVPTSDDLRSGKDPCLDRAIELARTESSAKKVMPSSK